ncbi:hypothetical protein D3C76_1678180 [compost metagenome]
MRQDTFSTYITQRLFNSFTGNLLIAKTDVGSNGACEQIRVLQYNPHMFANPLFRQIFDVLTVNRDLAFLRIIEPE